LYAFVYNFKSQTILQNVKDCEIKHKHNVNRSYLNVSENGKTYLHGNRKNYRLQF